jgi:bifunctional non-homologous end joining protein LigD
MAVRTRQPRDRSLDGLPKASMPAAPAPMLCTLVDRAFDSPKWIFEPKFDGLRILARFDGQDVTLVSRNNKPQELRFPEIAEAIRKSLDRPAIVDGEVVCFDAEGRTSFRELQQRFHLDDPDEIRRRMERHPAFIYFFDILHLDGRELTGLPLETRKDWLDRAVTWSDRVRRTEFERGGGVALLDRACKGGDEGIVGKRLDSRYVPGRADAWVKIKCVGRQEFAIGGWTDPQRSRVGLGALLVGYYDKDETFCYAGKVGTGYTRDVLLDLRRRLEEIGRDANPFEEGDPPAGEGVHWVRPTLVAEIAFAEWTQNGLLRQPRYGGLRPDKRPRDCRRERPKSVAAVRSHSRSGDTPMPLEHYRAKRDFKKTREPSGESKTKAHKQPIFVVQEHHASHLHYDFRLEADGVLKSWAVPKEPSMDPSIKRLAVQVEDHPLGYATFAGTIPKGQYGGGTVKIWDHGTYENLMEDKADGQTPAVAIDAGRIEFVLHGERLKGKFALIRMRPRGRGKPQWLLIKMKDEYAATEANGDVPKPKAARATSSNPTKSRRSSKPPKGEIELTHPDKVLFPEAGLTKRDVFTYYRRIADRLIPFLKDRPVTLERLPDGLTGDGAPHFWQKNTPESYPAWIPRVELETERGETVRYALVNDEPTLLYLVNQGTLTFHVWASRVEDLDRPDFVLFDLDPGRASFGDVVDVAKAVKGLLDEESVESFVKTSGKSGLHVLTPWTQKGGYDKAWALAIAQRVVSAMPGRATVERSKAKRGRRVYVDVMQNARGHHAVPPYVIRAVPAASVSTPLNWKELTPDLDPAAFTPKTIFRRLARLSRDPMAGLLKPARKRTAKVR